MQIRNDNPGTAPKVVGAAEAYKVAGTGLIEEARQQIEAALRSYFTEDHGYANILWEAMEYSLLAGGKRIRPVLLLLTGRSLGVRQDVLLPFGAAVEMIHTYSLIHDDLPAMDNDDYRRGRLTNHKVYGEDIAILAGDGLLTKAFEVIGEAMETAMNKGDSTLACREAKALSFLAGSAGCSGMIAGQTADLKAEGRIISPEELQYIETNKTGRLLAAPLVMAGHLAGAPENTLRDLEAAGLLTGLAFQIQDDVLDVEGSLASLGKTPGSDEKENKSTFVSLYGLTKAKEEAERLTKEALNRLTELPGPEGKAVRGLIKNLLQRDH